MNNLAVIEKTLTSLEVAEMIEITHANLLKDIRKHLDYMAKALESSRNSNEVKSYLVEFFQESFYTDAKGESRPCYLITRNGCEYIASKLSSVKGAAFSMAYIEKFHEMEDEIQGNSISYELSPGLQFMQTQLQMMIKMETQQKEIIESQKFLESKQSIIESKVYDTDNKLDNICEIVALRPDEWRKDSKALINKMALKLGGFEFIKPLWEEAHILLEERFGVNLSVRLTNKKKLLKQSGCCKSKIDKVNKLDVIAEDKKLIEGLIVIIKEMAIKYNISRD